MKKQVNDLHDAPEGSPSAKYLDLLQDEYSVACNVATFERLKHIPKFNSELKREQKKLERLRKNLLNIGKKITRQQFEEYIEPIVCYTWEEFQEDYVEKPK